ncbi:hypothetical protein ml_329 [Mollivirus sibericum]|uniref:hypothetical protein n=1 Tax=Mollivirus sibericum TaxID=1678078 RepID=UPI0006B2EAFD|nr:hypothetical protein ml_329 [Mollivirus sibericum]ALD62131.1 hypothetical protein ml_329 [Mollivirus sibericum]
MQQQQQQDNEVARPARQGKPVRRGDFGTVRARTLAVERGRLPANESNLDGRRLKGPRPGEPPSPEWSSLPRLEQARINLNRARQLYSAGARFIESGLVMAERLGFDMRPDQVQAMERLVKRGRAMQVSTEPGEAESPRLGYKCALWELYSAYVLIRDYEVNPLPPLSPDGSPNVQRIQEDKAYEFIMGTARLEPNRLGIGQRARTVWLDATDGPVLDPNHYSDLQAAPPDEEVDEPDPEGGALYSSVAEGDARGPLVVATVKRWLSEFQGWTEGQRRDMDRTTVPNASDLNPSDIIAPIHTDMARALLDLHANFAPPVMMLADPREQHSDPRRFPPMTVYLPHAIPGLPYPIDAWPYLDVAAPEADEDRVPVFYTTGVMLPVILGEVSMPLAQDDLCRPPYVHNLNGREPVLGEPDSRLGLWDARKSCSLLCTLETRLRREAESGRQLRAALTDPLPEADSMRLTLWDQGPAAPDSWNVLGVPPSQTVGGARTGDRPVSTSYQARGLFARGFDGKVNLDFPIPLPLPGAFLVPTEALPFDVEIRAPFETYEMPRRVDWDQLCQLGDEASLAMINHALYLLGAPTTDWQKLRGLPYWLWLDDSDLAGGATTYGRSGEGTWGRDGHGAVDPLLPGWLQRRPASATNTSVEGRRQCNGETFATPGLRVANDMPIGPLVVDPFFCELDWLTPGDDWRGPSRQALEAWFVMTNQATVLGQPTHGLDFYGVASRPEVEESDQEE